MLKESTVKQRFEMIEEFLPEIVQMIRKDLRQEHLKQDKEFLNAHFSGKNPNKLSVDELVQGYAPLLCEGGEEYWDFFADRWLRRHTEMYYFFEEKLREYDENFTELEILEASFAKQLASEAKAMFGAQNAYIFAVFNEVVFPKEIYDEMLAKARVKDEVVEEIKVGENPEVRHQREQRNLQSKFEKKLLGLQKLYDRDVSALKKQVAALQRKLAARDE